MQRETWGVDIGIGYAYHQGFSNQPNYWTSQGWKTKGYEFKVQWALRNKVITTTIADQLNLSQEIMLNSSSFNINQWNRLVKKDSYC